MLGRETGENDRERTERDAGRGNERIQRGLPFAIALLAAVLLNEGRDDDAPPQGMAGEGANLADVAARIREGTNLADVATRVRDRVPLGGTGSADAGGSGIVDAGGSGATSSDWTDRVDSRLPDRVDSEWTDRVDADWTSDLPESVRTVATDGRLRRGAPAAAAVLAGLLLARRRDGGESSDRRAGAIDAVTQVRSRADAGATTTDADGTATTGASTTTGSAERGGQVDDAVGQADDTVTTGIDADVDDLWSPTTGGMPMLGVGTYRRADYDECLESVQQALQIGYRHVDTTDRREAYYAEEAVGDAVAESGVDRDDVFVATKVTPADLDREHVRTSAEESLDRLGMEYVDLLYVHWPTHDYEPAETLDAFTDLREDGLVDRIGVSNFTVELLEEALDVADAPIFANQVEMHPLLPQEDLREFCERAGVEVVAFSPIARGDVEDVTELQAVAAKHGATPEQVSLAWLREKGVAAIPRATSEDHLRENWRSLALDLDDEDVSRLDSIEERRRIVDPEEAPWNQ